MATDGYGSPIPNSVAKVHISSQSPNKISKKWRKSIKMPYSTGKKQGRHLSSHPGRPEYEPGGHREAPPLSRGTSHRVDQVLLPRLCQVWVCRLPVLNTSSIEMVKTYYKTLINEEASYVVVRADGSDIIFHAIQDADHFKEEKIQNPWEKRWISFVPEVGLHSQGFLLQRYTFLPNLQTKSQKMY